MLYKSTDKKLVVVLDAGALPELGYICGPILHPSKVRIDLIQKLVSNRRTVYECNPANPEERVKLTLRNVKKVIFQEPTNDSKELIKTIKPELIQGKDANVNIEERLKSLIDKPEILSTSDNEQHITEFIQPEEQINFESNESSIEVVTNDYTSDNINKESQSEPDDTSEEISEDESNLSDNNSDQSKEINNTFEASSNRRKNRKNRK